jgi:hypothetical protein
LAIGILHDAGSNKKYRMPKKYKRSKDSKGEPYEISIRT